MSQELKFIECDPKCGFMVRSHNKEEFVEMVVAHGKKMHPELNIPEDEIRSWIKPVSSAKNYVFLLLNYWELVIQQTKENKSDLAQELCDRNQN